MKSLGLGAVVLLILALIVGVACCPPPEATPTPTPTPEVTPEETPEVTPEVTPEETPEVTPEVGLTLSVGDTWEYLSTFPGKADSVFTVTVDSEEEAEGVDCYYTPVDMDPAAVRHVTTPMDIDITIDGSETWIAKATLDNVKQVANITAPIPSPATNTWAYTGDHGWPFEVGKTWSYDKTTVTTLGTDTVTWTVTVEGIEDVTVAAGTFSCYYIVHQDAAGAPMYEQWWSEEVKNNVKTVDYATYSDLETQELQSYTVAP